MDAAERTAAARGRLAGHPDVDAVVHAHPPAVVAADLAGLRIRPVVGAFDIPGAKLAAGGVPVYPRGVLISVTDDWRPRWFRPWARDLSSCSAGMG